MKSYRILLGICDFGWGSLGKASLILDQIDFAEIGLFGGGSAAEKAEEFFGDRICAKPIDPDEADLAIVINDPGLVHQLADAGLRVIYVDSLPYLWNARDEVPRRGSVHSYCTQRYPLEGRQIAGCHPQEDIHDVFWVEPIVPPARAAVGGKGVTINLGGLHSHMVDSADEAYLDLVLMPLIDALNDARRTVGAVCGNLSPQTIAKLERKLPDAQSIGPLSPKAFANVLVHSDQLLTSPGSTTILQAANMRLPTRLLPPQNLSQILNTKIYGNPEIKPLHWPEEVINLDAVETLRPQGEEAVLSFIYDAIRGAQGASGVQSQLKNLLQAVAEEPIIDQLDPAVRMLGNKGAYQIGRIVRRALFAP